MTRKRFLEIAKEYEFPTAEKMWDTRHIRREYMNSEVGLNDIDEEAIRKVFKVRQEERIMKGVVDANKH